MSKNFKDDMLNSLGAGAKCISSSVDNKKITTFIIVSDSQSKNSRRHLCKSVKDDRPKTNKDLRSHQE